MYQIQLFRIFCRAVEHPITKYFSAIAQSASVLGRYFRSSINETMVLRDK